ncbi:MAG TPA: HAMP domain-containing sensor histidine kinase [Gaiellaceae bacterium]|nr:HAMP domain-containing sensor histidine kinase [Gaiellaceae bacterium]
MTKRLATRIALASLVVAALAVAVLGVAVLGAGRSTFERLMAEHGASIADSRAMFNESVTVAFAVAVVVAAVGATIVAALLGLQVSRPLVAMAYAAREIARGNYDVRVPRAGPEEIASLADSFNQMAERLAESERQRREFIANAAHELRTPLTNLVGYLEALRDEVVPPERATFDSLREEADRLVRLSRSLDALAEGDLARRPAALAEIDLAAAVGSAIELAQPAFDRRGIRVERRLPPRLLALADPDHLAQVLSNLLENAARYSNDGGRVTVTAEQGSSDVTVTVTNTGDGIPAEDLPRVFERFYRVERSRDRAHGGAGIGLAIVKQLVELAGGRVGVESSGGVTRFWFSLRS